jgi:hypothetical protein
MNEQIASKHQPTEKAPLFGGTGNWSRPIARVTDTSVRKVVVTTEKDTALVIIGAFALMIAFATLVLKIVEVARSK